MRIDFHSRSRSHLSRRMSSSPAPGLLCLAILALLLGACQREEPPAGPAHEVPAPAVNDPQAGARAQALEQLQGATREEADAQADLLVRGLNDPSPQVRETARRQFIDLYQHQRATPHVFVKVLGSYDPEARADAAWQLGNAFAVPTSGTRVAPTPETVEALRAALHDPVPKVRIYAARALFSADPGARDVVTATLREAMGAATVDFQVRAARILWQATHVATEVLPVYQKALDSGGKYVRFEAMDGIREMGPAAAPLRPALERLRDDADRETQRRAQLTLAALSPRG